MKLKAKEATTKDFRRKVTKKSSLNKLKVKDLQLNLPKLKNFCTYPKINQATTKIRILKARSLPKFKKNKSVFANPLVLRASSKLRKNFWIGKSLTICNRQKARNHSLKMISLKMLKQKQNKKTKWLTNPFNILA